VNRERLLAAYADHTAGRVDAAVEAYRAILASEPDNADALNLLAVARRAAGALDEALDLLARAVRSSSRFPDAWYNYGNALAAAGRPAEAADAYRRVLALDPSRAGAEANLGIVLADAGDQIGARAAYERALALDPAHAVARHNLGNLLGDLGAPDLGMRHLRTVAAAEPALAEARYNLALALLRAGDYTAGFRDYESRWRAPGFTGVRLHRDLPDWTGEPFPDKALIVHAEQGLGDTLQFVRLLPLVRSLGGRVTLEIPVPLKRLLEGVPGADRVADETEDFSGHDLVVPMLSLPYRLKLTLGSIPARVPYLAAEPARLDLWRRRLGDRGRLVAVCFRGNPKAPVDRGRSLPDPAILAPLAEIPRIRLLAVNKLDPPELAESDGRWRIAAAPFLEHPGPDFDAGRDAFLDTAAVLALADIVVTTDTSVAHLAGALARPTFLMLKHAPDWRWMTDRPDTPWYPTMHLIRQPAPGDWSAVIAEVAARLA
jgi:hypothetical protein